MVAKTPLDRYQTMAEVIAELEQCRSGSMAGPPVVSIATAEDARLDEFLRGMAAPSKQRAVPRQKASRAVATAVAPEPARTADLEATLDLATPQVATDPKTEQSLPGGRVVPPAAEKVRRPPRPPWWQDRRILAAAAGGLLVVLLGIWVVITFGFPWFAQELNDFSLFGFPLGFYMAAQGTLVIYLFLIWIYNRRMRQLEKRFGIDDE